jgi:hypothetical protein
VHVIAGAPADEQAEHAAALAAARAEFAARAVPQFEGERGERGGATTERGLKEAAALRRVQQWATTLARAGMR